MCFAPEADAVIGAAVVAVGVDALRHVTEPKQIPLAALPLLFGLHELTEAFVWWGLQEQLPRSVERVTMWVYLLFALAALPALLPIAVALVERSKAHRRVIAAFALLGIMVGATLLAAMIRGPITAEIDGWHISYNVESLGRGGQLTALYVVATCGALLASSSRDLRLLGALNLVAVPVLVWLTLGGFVSLWCFWAAIVSVGIAMYMRRQAAVPRPPLPVGAVP